jgi:hypothetical protein
MAIFTPIGGEFRAFGPIRDGDFLPLPLEHLEILRRPGDRSPSWAGLIWAISGQKVDIPGRPTVRTAESSDD